MMKQLMIATAASGILLSAALAQSPTLPPSVPPAGKPPAAAGQTLNSASKADKGPQIVTSQRPGQHLASKFNGTDVLGADGKKIGDVADVLFDKDGKVLAYIVSVGGFLGIGSKDVAMAPSAFEIIKSTSGNADKLKIALSQDDLKQMARFEPYKPPRPTTTGAAPASGTAIQPRSTGGGNR